MGLLGGGKKTSTSKVELPGYVKDLVNNIYTQSQGTKLGDYTNRQFADLNADQKAALAEMLGGSNLDQYTQQLISSGQEGLQHLDNVYQQYNDLLKNGSITPEQINQVAQQFYSPEDVQAAIDANNKQMLTGYSRETAPALAMNYNAGRAGLTGEGFGSGARVARDMAQSNLAQQQQAGATDISQQAYANAQNQAQNYLTGNRQSQLNALSGLYANASNQAGYLNQGALMNQQGLQQGVGAAQQQYINEQNRLNNETQNQQYKQDWNNLENQYKLNLASGLNGALGQTTTTTTSGGGGLMGVLGGAATGAIQGFLTTGNPYGAMAGAAIGGIGAAASQ